MSVIHPGMKDRGRGSRCPSANNTIFENSDLAKYNICSSLMLEVSFGVSDHCWIRCFGCQIYLCAHCIRRLDLDLLPSFIRTCPFTFVPSFLSFLPSFFVLIPLSLSLSNFLRPFPFPLVPLSRPSLAPHHRRPLVPFVAPSLLQKVSYNFGFVPVFFYTLLMDSFYWHKMDPLYVPYTELIGLIRMIIAKHCVYSANYV